ncbi:MAG: NAD(P)-dependent oxidoreductase [SAR202 cluster bacterium]|jgi:nucleoside-diphosphate-sugar epimerase|nr:NAD(P)-dependent oxidoreductase [SAR202 cluster bacterium]
MTKQKVLITGMAGRIGTVAHTRLADKYDFTSLDNVQVDNFPSHIADLADFEAMRSAFDGQETVVHLAAEPSADAPWEVILRNNIIGTYNVMKASRESGVKRVVFASTNHVVGNIPMKEEPYKSIYEDRLENQPMSVPMVTAERHRPDGYYAISKSFGEQIGSYYYDEYGISFIALRIGGVNEENSPWTMGPLGRSLYLSHQDAAHLIDCSIGAPPSVGFAIVYGISNNQLRFHDIETAGDLIGYHPQDNAGI